MFEQHIITDQDRRAHSEGKIAISLNYKAGHDPYLSITSNNSVGLAGNISIQVEINNTNKAKGPITVHQQQYNQLAEVYFRRRFKFSQGSKSQTLKIKAPSFFIFMNHTPIPTDVIMRFWMTSVVLDLCAAVDCEPVCVCVRPAVICSHTHKTIVCLHPAMVEGPFSLSLFLSRWVFRLSSPA